MTASVSIIIPTLNEADRINATLTQLSILQPPAAEIIVVDGGSQDATVAIAQTYPVTVLISPQPGRSIQMNLGVEVATGDLLCFLHADTEIPRDGIDVIQSTLQDRAIACGGFVSLMVGPHTTRWGISLHNYLKTFYAPLLFRPHLFLGKGLRLLFGDQAMFCRKVDFQHCGGFNDQLSIMEDADLCLKLCHYGRIQLVNRVVFSSDRRVTQWGVWKATMRYVLIGFLWGLGVPASFLKQLYEEVR